jgi:hypothetical protein
MVMRSRLFPPDTFLSRYGHSKNLTKQVFVG